MPQRSHARFHAWWLTYRLRIVLYALLPPLVWMDPVGTGFPASVVLGFKILYWIYTFPSEPLREAFSMRAIGLSPRTLALLLGASTAVGLMLVWFDDGRAHGALKWTGSVVIFCAVEAALWIREADCRHRLNTQHPTA